MALVLLGAEHHLNTILDGICLSLSGGHMAIDVFRLLGTLAWISRSFLNRELLPHHIETLFLRASSSAPNFPNHPTSYAREATARSSALDTSWLRILQYRMVAEPTFRRKAESAVSRSRGDSHQHTSSSRGRSDIRLKSYIARRNFSFGRHPSAGVGEEETEATWTLVVMGGIWAALVAGCLYCATGDGEGFSSFAEDAWPGMDYRALSM